MKNTVAATPTTLRILGIDPGLRATGFGVIDRTGQKLVYVTSGVIRSTETDELPARLHTIFSGIAQIIGNTAPTIGAVEKVFVNVNPQSTLLLGQARGAAITALVHAGLPVSEYTALQVKQAVVGHGKAAKEQVGFMVRRLLNLPGDPPADAADALACAICHAHSLAMQGVAGTGARRRGGRAL